MLSSNFAQPAIGGKFDSVANQTAQVSAAKPAIVRELAALNTQKLTPLADPDDQKAQEKAQANFKDAYAAGVNGSTVLAAAKAPNAPADIKDAAQAALSAGGSAGFQTTLLLPVFLIFAFGAIFLYDRSRGGYKKETLSETALENAEMTPVNQA